MSAEIWAIGGGKGGTGKSFVASSLGINLAREGKGVILIDGDLGGANLHSFFGQKRVENTLSDFFENKLSLEEIMGDTQISNLQLVTGDIRSFDPQGIKYTQKLRFFRHIRKLDADFVLIDLGAGSGLNIIDTLLLADKMIMVIVPEITAIENLYNFLKRALFRKLNIIMRKHRLKNTALEAWQTRKSEGIRTFGQLIKHLRGISYEVSQIIEEELGNFKIYLILNQVRNSDHIEMGSSIRSVIVKYFGIDAKYVGYVGYNDLFWKYINQVEPFSRVLTSISVSSEISTMTRNLLHDQQMKLTGIAHA